LSHVARSIQQISKFTSSYTHTHTHTHTLMHLEWNYYNPTYSMLHVSTTWQQSISAFKWFLFLLLLLLLLLYQVAASNADVQKYVMKFLITELYVQFSAMFRDFSWSVVLGWCVHLLSDQQSVLKYAKVRILYIISDIHILKFVF
jgi:hypothetical protein